MKKFKRAMMATLILLSSVLLTACNGKQELQVNSHPVASISIPADAFVCSEKPAKPVKVKKPDGTMGYRSSDTAKLLARTEEARANCETQLHSVRDIYNLQMEANLKSKP